MTEIKIFWANYNIPPTYRLGGPGMGCAGDPPNYPSYSVRPIYTQSGNHPPWNRCPQIYYKGHGYAAFEDINIEANWKKLPLDHMRVKAWIMDLFHHHNKCYIDPEKFEANGGRFHNATFIYPVPDYELDTFIDDERFSDEWRAAEKKAVELKNREIRKAARKLASFDSHCATFLVRRHYPEFNPPEETRIKLECNPVNVASWWERFDLPPTNANGSTCPGTGKGCYNRPHPANGSWCQVCGWTEESGMEKEDEVVNILKAMIIK
jgi:hypothetical protein